jgi:DNA-binding GntR family transcriptional regulator
LVYSTALEDTVEISSSAPPIAEQPSEPLRDWRLDLTLPSGATGQLGDDVYLAVRGALRRGVIVAGSRLVEGDIAAALAVSRTPVREALQRLEADGLVRQAGNRGYVAADLMADAEQVFLIRERLEGLAAALAARHITLPELEELNELQTRMEAAIAAPEVDVESLVTLNFRFHVDITQASRSPRLEAMVDRLHPEYVSYQVVRNYNVEERRLSIAEHRAIVDALWNRDAALADRLVQAHLERGKAVVLEGMRSSSPKGASAKRSDRRSLQEEAQD